MKYFDTPILFVIFNRPETTQIVFDEIKKIKPRKLFITADGPRKHKLDESKKCMQARQIIDQIDWDCQIYKNYSDVNLGCKIAVSSGINWFFNNVEEGIILEDDCAPNESFFTFCEEMLDRYRNDNRIMHINGSNFQFGKNRGDGDYYFSKISHVWGWATWRRAWKYYDMDLKSLDNFIVNNYIKGTFINKRIENDFINLLKKTKNNKIDTWDYQWTYSVWSQNGLSLSPNKNLVKNIGFGKTATHTKSSNAKLENNDAMHFLVHKHPTMIIRDIEADLYFYKQTKRAIIARILAKLKQYV